MNVVHRHPGRFLTAEPAAMANELPAVSMMKRMAAWALNESRVQSLLADTALLLDRFRVVHTERDLALTMHSHLIVHDQGLKHPRTNNVRARFIDATGEPPRFVSQENMKLRCGRQTDEPAEFRPGTLGK